MEYRVAVVGLGYVGLPVAVAFARKTANVIGFDADRKRIEELHAGFDRTKEISKQELASVEIELAADPEKLRDANFFVVAVPTPIDENRQPNLSALESACEILGPRLSPGAIVVFESTVWPGVTEDICGPILEKYSGLRCGEDFKLGYSPERINPGDKQRQLENITKVVAGQDEDALQVISEMYAQIITAGIYRASSIKVAEAAKVIENTQRDLNIALMNELAVIFERLGIETRDVLAAAETKWNFLPFKPGLVGGHCIGVDPYYLTAKAKQSGYYPQLILAGRRINDGMSAFVVDKLVKMLIDAEIQVKKARVGILGITFKENVNDLRNSRVPEIYNGLAEMGVDVLVHDPLVGEEEISAEHAIKLSDFEEFTGLDALIL
ncbi:MAG: nucleotide sugar dehydrogenase, partial [Gammaproteobacteria bacterium]|nr:nucleotide sugar dehydrogenase [Gammaproteobacteria bacterium]